MSAKVEPASIYRSWEGIDYQPAVSELPPTALLKVMRPGQRVLEIGCGTGGNVALMASAGLTVEGWDINPAAISKAEKRLEEAGLGGMAKLVSGDFLTCPELPMAVDAVVMIRVLTCVPDVEEWRTLLHRARLCIRPGGYLYVNDFLQNPVTYEGRYEQGLEMGWRAGTFGVPAGHKTPDFLAYHHSEGDIDEISAPYVVQRLNRSASLSMNGNNVEMFELLAKYASLSVNEG
jgi:ubiquinone/menaquinone biosynthesis C-methylase UbiE